MRFTEFKSSSTLSWPPSSWKHRAIHRFYCKTSSRRGHKTPISLQTGTSLKNAGLKAITRNDIAESIPENAGSGSRGGLSIGLFFSKLSNRIASELLVVLERLRAKGRRGKWSSFQQAFRSLWSEHDIDLLRNVP